ncbi:substrate-binding domain-containing protein [Vibrio hangzhouensis]|nr:substrate-binding domain-containing protein [Vibrio hangzhouensis]
MVIVFVAAWYLLNHTRFGRYVYALGGNESATRLSGINVDKVKIGVYAICGLLAALGGYLATKHLIESGHSEIGCITGPLNRHQALMCYEGYKKALKEKGIILNPDWVIESDFECDGGAKSLDTLIARGQLPTSIFVCNDMMAMGVINAAHSKGIKVPDDLSVIGYDDIHIAKYMTPSLTTIHQPKYRLGKAAVETLLAKIEKTTLASDVVQLEPTLIVRDSVKLLS